MKTYEIPVHHTATTTTKHRVEGKSMQDAMFQLGQKLADISNPFACAIDEGDAEIELVSKPGSPVIVPDDSQGALDLADEIATGEPATEAPPA
mgnify:CR=1 FL=1